MTTASDLQVVPHRPSATPALRAADRGVADALESVLSDNTRRVYGTQWRIFESWCGEMGLHSLPAEPLTVARYLAARANSGASIATLRLAASASAKAHEWAGRESPCKDRGVRASLRGWGRRLGKPQRQSGALTAAVLAVIRLTAVQPRLRGRGFETAEQAAERAKFDAALVAVLSYGGLRRSEAACHVSILIQPEGRMQRARMAFVGASYSYVSTLIQPEGRMQPRADQGSAVREVRVSILIQPEGRMQPSSV